MRSSSTRILCLALLVPACGGGPSVKVTAAGLASGAAAGVAASALRLGGREAALGEGEYDGIGINYSQAVVDGLRVDLTGIVFGSGRKGDGNETTVFDWHASPRTIEIRDGFADTVEDTAQVPVGTYDFLEVHYAGHYSVKAYAYFDADFDGVVDTTLYTTATEVKKVDTKLLPSELAGYDYYTYDRTYVHLAPGAEAFQFVMPREPLVVAEGSGPLSVDLRIDSFRVVTAWDGRPGTGTYPPTTPGELPPPGPPFGYQGSAWSYEPGTPTFGLNYVPMFAFGRSGDGTTPITSQTFLASRTGAFDPFDSGILTVVFDGTGVPLVGTIADAAWLGELAKDFDVQADGRWSFYSGGTSAIDDGGFWYSNDPARAAHFVEGFRPLDAVGDLDTITLENAARCDDVWNYCVADADGNATATNGASAPLYLERVR